MNAPIWIVLRAMASLIVALIAADTVQTVVQLRRSGRYDRWDVAVGVAIPLTCAAMLWVLLLGSLLC